jgi:hypothetical protein
VSKDDGWPGSCDTLCQNVIMRDLPIPGWRLHIIRSKLGCQTKKKAELDTHAPGWCLDMVEAEEEVYLELTHNLGDVVRRC